MVINLKTVFVLIGVICLFAAGLKVSSPRVDFLALGLAFIALGEFVL